jgi:hypothetical protein
MANSFAFFINTFPLLPKHVLSESKAFFHLKDTSQGVNQTRRQTKYEGERTGTQNKLGWLMKDNPIQK